MRAMSFESVGIFRPGCPARPAAARFRRAFEWPILTRPPIRATQPWSPLQISVKAFSYGMNIALPIGKESLTKQKKNFPLELRTKTFLLLSLASSICQTTYIISILKRIRKVEKKMTYSINVGI